MFSLTDKVAIVTGGTSGIGKEIAKEYANAGAKVVVVGRNEKAGNHIVSDIESNNGIAFFKKTDVTNSEEIKDCVKKTVETYGTVDVLVNSAGIHDQYANLLETSEEEFDKVIGVNVKAALLMAKEVLPIMLDKGNGKIINLGSQGTFVAGPGGASYVTSKHAIQGLTKQISYDFGKKGIQCNLLCPGYIDTPMTEGSEDERLKGIPAQRAGRPEEIAPMAVFLASDASSYAQGASFTLDGGWSIGR